MSYTPNEDAPKQESRWGRCQAASCPLEATIDAAELLCTFHHGQERRYYSEVSMSIREYMQDYRRYGKMTRWSASEWAENSHMLKTDGFVDCSDMGDHLMPNIYLNRFRTALGALIDARASDIIANPLQRRTGGWASDDGLWGNQS